MRDLHGGAALPAAKRNLLVLYRSRDASGATVAVSGSVAIPRGRPPRGGWPVISWAYGVVGLADRCAPTREGPNYPSRSYLTSVEPTINGWVKAGYAVVRTDYAGLGTPGVYPYLVGRPTARSVLDMIRAARRVDPSLGRRFVSAGHSSGGHAALWAGGMAARYTPELQLRGIVAYAPSSHADQWLPVAPALTSPSPASVFYALAVRTFNAAYPKLHLSNELSPQFERDLYPQTLTKCVSELWQEPRWMSLAPADVFRPGADLRPFIPILKRNEPTEAGITGRVLLLQGTKDDSVFPAWTADVARRLRKAGTEVEYRTYDATHNGVLAAARRDANAWIRARLQRR
jgi:dienelactone hydrolase